MLSELIDRAERGESLWLPDLRDFFAALPDARPIQLRLLRIDGIPESKTLYIPIWHSPKEERFVQEYLWAHVYNLLAVFSGCELCLGFDLNDPELSSLADSLPETFQLNVQQRKGYGKVLNIADRLCAASGLPSFRFSRELLQPVQSTRAVTCSLPDLPETLRACCTAAEGKTLCGIDIGGTDIKLALSVDNQLVCTGEYDWNPQEYKTAEEILHPVLHQVELLRERAAKCLGLPNTPLLDGIGISFPDVVIGNRILGGETPKTAGIRNNPGVSYETEFGKLATLAERLQPQCRPGSPIRIINDGNMAAFTAAVELACSPDAQSVRDGIFAHTLGTDLGSGYLLPDGTVPSLPLEFYDLILDLGNYPARKLPPEDLRSTRNENSGMPGIRRYLGQAAAFRIAWELDPALLEGFTEKEEDMLLLRMHPEDLRKPCLAHLMQMADNGNPVAQEVFRQIGRNLGIICREADDLLHPVSRRRFLYGRFVRSETCFRFIQEGCSETAPSFMLVVPDENLACSPLMRQLADRTGTSIAQFGQAIGAIYLALKA